MLTKIQAKIMEIFVSNLSKKFSIKEISEVMKKPYPLIHRSIKLLISNKFIDRDEKKLLSLNYKENHQELAYIESIIKDRFLDKNKTIALFVKGSLEKLNLSSFIFIIFGSYARNQNKPRDVDVLLIVEDKNKVSNIEKVLCNIADNFTLDFHINVISPESAGQMLAKRDKINIMNEILNNHILIFGAENYYRMLKDAR